MRILCFLLALLFFTPAAAEIPVEWKLSPQDAKGVLPNDPSPPQERADLPALKPLPPEEQGTVRSVDVGDEKLVALTFDLCELATSTTGCDMELLGFLREQGVPATLFMGGKWMRTHRERTVQIMLEPLFEIGSHAWTHGNFGIMKEESMREQILGAEAEYAILREEALQRAAEQGLEADIPAVPSLFRLPYGRCSDAALALLAGHGLQVIQWDVAAELGKDNARPEVARAAVKLIKPGSIVLMHANLVPKGTAGLVRILTEELKRQGWRFVKVGELLGMGSPVRVREGYFTVPGDNLALDTKFGIDGTGRKK